MKWHKEPPPHVGWWLCQDDWWRWWDGRVWSFGVKSDARIANVKRSARMPVVEGACIEWTHYWPAGARVPRVEP